MKKKVLYILNLPPPVYGANVVGDFIKSSKKINAAFDGDYINLTTEKKLNSVGKLDLGKIAACFILYAKVLSHVIKKRYDLYYMTINAKGNGFYKDFPVVILLKIFKAKTVYHYHNKGVAAGENVWWLNRMYKYQFKNAHVILLSPLMYHDIAKYVAKENVHFCANGVPEIPDIDIDAINKKRLKKAVTQMLFLSNMMKEKGVFVLLNACKLLAEKQSNFKMIFIGGLVDITEQEFTEYVNENNLTNLVEYKGKKHGAEKAAYFENADVFVFPTFYHNEVFPLVILEAMQYALPIISTREGGIPDMIAENENGFLVNKQDPADLALKLRCLIENETLRQEMGTIGLKKFNSFFSLPLFEANFINILNNIAG